MCNSEYKAKRNTEPQEHVCPRCGSRNSVGQILTTSAYKASDAVFGGYCTNCNIEFIGNKILIDYSANFKEHP